MHNIALGENIWMGKAFLRATKRQQGGSAGRLCGGMREQKKTLVGCKSMVVVWRLCKRGRFTC